jgi:transcriptional repressor of dcmA and dcmR
VTQGEFLTVRQAAAVLGVSALSLRRWTKSGLLPCARVGRRGDRRFRRADLLAFLDRADVHGGVRTTRHDHRCAFYTSSSERIAQVASFVADGIDEGAYCVVAAEASTHAAIRSAVTGRISAARRGTPDSSPAWELAEYAESAAAQIERWQEVLGAALATGDRPLRVVGDVSSAPFAGGAEFEAVIHYEREYDRLIARPFGTATLCQYDARRVTGGELLELLVLHDGYCAFR